MKTCSNCGASNPDVAKYCNECAAALAPAAPPKSVAEPIARKDASSLARSLSIKAETLQSKRRADIMFVLDCTGSMQGEIDAIRDAIMAFADTIKSDGVRARVGLIEFRDRFEGEEARVLMFAGTPFTGDPLSFRKEVSALRATGGGDEPESSLDAVMLALKQPFAADASKIIVLVTDAPPHIPDRETKNVEEVSQAIRGGRIEQLYIVARLQDSRNQVYHKLIEGTRGLAFELGRGDDFRERAEHFKRTLMALGKTISQRTL